MMLETCTWIGSNLEKKKTKIISGKTLQENSQRKVSTKLSQKCHAIATTEF
jgi:hypothetical protein